METRLSVVVCTYNRCEWLDVVLGTLVEQSASPPEYEVLVVDNNSTDDTCRVVHRYAGGPVSVRYFHESRQGLSNARNRGWRESSAPYVAYIDDDAKAPEHWVETALRIIDRVSPDVFGGPNYGFYTSATPSWWKEQYRVCEPAGEARLLQEGEYLSGNNMAFRRSLFERVGDFDDRFGMNGETLAVGEETDLLLRIRENVPEAVIYYDPAFYIYHLVHEDRMAIGRLIPRWFATGRALYHLPKLTNGTPDVHPVRHLAYSARRFVEDVGFSLFRRDREAYPHWQNYFYERTSGHVVRLGRAFERLHSRRRQAIH